MRRWTFSKGHGTQNDFVLLLDREAMMRPKEAEVRFLCDRRLGVGGDGLLRVVRAQHIDGWAGNPDLWFMDYRNADGSIAEMCGNGVRVFARYLLDEGLVTGPVIPIATRAGLKEATVLVDGRIRVAMGAALVTDAGVVVTTAAGEHYDALSVDVGNPHAVSFVEGVDGVGGVDGVDGVGGAEGVDGVGGADALTQLSLEVTPSWTPSDAFPHGVNFEFVHTVGPRHIAIRIYERGVGETKSCGTGAVAAAAASRVRLVGEPADGVVVGEPADGEAVTYWVDVCGGTVEVELAADGQSYLTGPAVIVAHGQVSLPEEL